MIYFAIFFIELFLLFLLSRVLAQEMFNVFYKFSKSKKASIYCISLLFLPGTILHEMSHFFTAIVLFVKTGEIELLPKIDQDHIRLGSVGIYQTDFLRRFIVGISPFLIGNIVIFLLLSYAVSNNLLVNPIVIFILIYSLFVIGNTMFSSKEDMKGILELLGGLIFILIFLYMLGLRLPQIKFNILEQEFIIKIARQAALYISFPVLIDGFLIIFLRLINRKREL